MIFSGFSWTCKKKKNLVSFALLWNLKYSLVPKKEETAAKEKKEPTGMSEKRKTLRSFQCLLFFCQWSRVFVLLKLDAGVCPSTLLKSHNKWRKWSKTTNYSETGKESAQQWSLLHFPYMYIQSDFSVYTIKSWNPGFKIEISCKESQESSNPLVDMLFDGLFSICIIFLKNFNYCCSPKLGLFC